MTVSVTSSNISRTSLVEPDKTLTDAPSSAMPQISSSSQPFTDLLVEATSKVLRAGLAKPEVPDNPTHRQGATKVAALKDAKGESPETRSKKSVSIDRSTPSTPIFETPIPLIVIDSTPIAVPAVAPLAKQAVPKQATSMQVKVDAVTTIDVLDTRPTAPILNIDRVKDPGIEKSVRRESDSPVPAVAAPPQRFQFDEAKPIATHDQPPILTTESAKSASVEGEIHAAPIPLLRDPVVAPAVHVSSPPVLPSLKVPINPRETSTPVDTKESIATKDFIRTKESIATKDFIRTKESIATKESESIGDHPSPNTVRTERAEPQVVPILPIHPPVVTPGTNVLAAPAHVTSSSSHALDVGALVGAISRPLDEARGGYTVVIAMHPVELGHVQAVVTLHGIDLHVSITPQTQMGHDALTQAVDTLKTDLSRGGVNVNVTLQDPGSQPRGENRPPVAPAPLEAFIPEDPVVVTSPPPVLSANQVNLVL